MSEMRKYLLGQLDEKESADIEQEYFTRASAIDAMESVEEELIEDYLGGRLEPDELSRFTRVYRASPAHVRRVQTIRGIAAAAARRHRPVPKRSLYAGLATAAVALLAVGGWWVSSRAPMPQSVEQERGAASGSPSPSVPEASEPAPPAVVPRIFAVSISPVTVRSADGSRDVTMPEGTDILALTLEGDMDPARTKSMWVMLRTAGGDEVWRGPASRPLEGRSGAGARVEIPAASLPADDYIVTLFSTDVSGVETEEARYFLQLRRK